MTRTCLLRGARVATGPATAERIDVEIGGGRIVGMGARPAANAKVMELDGHMILPGLVNAHDHLDFNLFPRLGRGPYPNAGAWARDIYRPAEPPVREQLQVPAQMRLLWGALKNLMSGVTTVAHHNPPDPCIFSRGFPVRVVARMGWAHSLEFSPDLPERCRATPPDWPFIVHLGEGTDLASRNELARLIALDALDGRTVLVHAVALGGEELRRVREHGAAVVWCPTSNLFLLGKTLDAAIFASGIPLALGSDSALTAEGDLLDEIAAARRHGIDEQRLYRMVTDEAAGILRLGSGEGRIVEGGVADLAVVPDAGVAPAAALGSWRAPELLMVGGRVQLINPALATRLPATGGPFHRLAIEGRGEVLVAVDIPGLYAATARALGGTPRLAGRCAT